MSLTALLSRIEDKRDELIALTRDLVKIPTTNPPGENYSDCSHYIGERLAARDFEVSYVRAEGAIGDSDRYPRDNVIARHTGTRQGPCVHFNSHIDVVETGAGWQFDPFAATVADRRKRRNLG